VRDFHGNGKKDLVVVNTTSNNFSYLASNGDGTFGAADNYVTGVGPVFGSSGGLQSRRQG
jgi:hypothetical protein